MHPISYVFTSEHPTFILISRHIAIHSPRDMVMQRIGYQ